jgi:hypothetical protein
MTNKFLGSSEAGDLTNGSLNIIAASLSATNFQPSMALKTDAISRLVSSDLLISDVSGLQDQLDNVNTWSRGGTLLLPTNSGDTVGFSTLRSENGVDDILVSNTLDCQDHIKTDLISESTGSANITMNNNVIMAGTTTLNVNNVVPNVDDVGTIGTSSKRFCDAFFLDENNVEFTARNLAEYIKLLSNSGSIRLYNGSHSVVGGVWTYTLTDTSGTGTLTFSIDGKILQHPSPTMSLNITSYAGTDLLPKDIYVYVINDGADNPIMTASDTEPELSAISHTNVASFKAGSVSASSVKIYAEFSSGIFPHDFLHKTFNTFYDRGSYYDAGMGIISTASDVSIASGRVHTALDSLNSNAVQVSVNSYFYILSNGNFTSRTDFGITNYGDGGVIGANKYFNVVLGIITNGTTQIMALVQNEPTSEYISTQQARNDVSSVTVYAPNDTVLKKQFVGVCRVIVQNIGGGTLQIVDGVNYHLDLRGTPLGTAGGGSGITDHGGLTGLSDDDHSIYLLSNGRVASDTIINVPTGQNK